MSTKFYSGQKDYIPKLNEMDQAFQDAMGYLTGSTAAPLPLGTATAGVIAKYAREDHVHPSTGTTQSVGDNTTQYATTAFVQGEFADKFSKALNFGSNVTVAGNLTVNGTTYTVNSTTVTVDDPVITLGGDTAPTSDDNKDRGIEFRYYNGTAKVGFYGYDDSLGKFIFLTDATNTSEVFTGTTGTIVANIEGNVTGNVTGNVSGTAANITGVAAVTNGGTGFSSYDVGDLLYASTTTALSKLADVATGNVLLSGGVGVAPSYGKVGLTTHVSGTLPIANGGTNSTATPTNGGVSYGTGTSFAFSAAGTAGQVLTSAGAAAPTWTTATSSNTASAIVQRDTNGDFSARNISVTGISALGVAYLNGASIYTGYASGLTINYAGIGTQYGITMKPGSSTADTHAITFLTSGSTVGSATAMATIDHLSGDAGMNLTGTWKLGGTAIATTASNITGTAAGLSSTLVVGSGGTGLTSYAVGDILYASGTSTLAKLADVATGNVLISGGVGVAPSYGKVGLTTHVSGTLAVGNGGTGLTATTQGGIVYGSSAAGYAMTAGTSGQVLTSAGTAAPTWTTATDLNTASAIVKRDASGNFSAGTVTLTSLASTGNITHGTGTNYGTAASPTFMQAGYSTVDQGRIILNHATTGYATIGTNGTGSLWFGLVSSADGLTSPVKYQTFDTSGNATFIGNVSLSGTGAVKLPVGTNANRPAASQGQIRYNTDISSFEGYNGTAWGSIGGGATGGGSDRVFQENDQTVTADYTIASGRNAMSAGPISVSNGVTVTIPNGSVWTIV